jgi:hypothetical protein
MKVYGGVQVYIHVSLNLALGGGKEPSVPFGLGAEWDPEPVWTTWRKFLTQVGLELPPNRCSPHSQSLYQLGYRLWVS